MLVRFWGTRGSIAKPGPDTFRFGGNTSCVEFRSGAGTLLVLTHHDPLRNDAAIDLILARVRLDLADRGSPLEVLAALRPWQGWRTGIWRRPSPRPCAWRACPAAWPTVKRT